jgi:hypothetical protein
VSALRFRPEVMRVPWQAIAGFAVVLYGVRSALRGWDFLPNVLDYVVFGGLALLLIARPLVVRWLSEDGGEDEAPQD